MRSILAASTIALLYAASTLATPWIGKVPPPYKPLTWTKTATRFTLSNQIYRTDLVKFESFIGPKPFQTWLQQTLDYSLVKPLFEQVQAHIRKPLKNRAEAHITVITPPEFDQVLKPAGVTMEEINKIAKPWIQKAEFTVKCLGRARINLNYQAEKDDAYFVVVDSLDLLRIREEIEKLFITKGGEPSLFDANAFWPHMTLGFTTRDMFSGDGVWKGQNACWADVKMINGRERSPRRNNKNSIDDESAGEPAEAAPAPVNEPANAPASEPVNEANEHKEVDDDDDGENDEGVSPDERR